MKWGVIKHNIVKFIGSFCSIQTLCTFKANTKKTLQKDFGLKYNEKSQTLEFHLHSLLVDVQGCPLLG
jgi:hypothetical protein